MEALNPDRVELGCKVIRFVVQDTRAKTVLSKSLTISNLSETNMVRFKIKCTTPFNYIVRPFEDTLAPGSCIQINIRAVIADRQLGKFNLDKFEVLSKKITSQEEALFQRFFWENSYSQRLDVEMVLVKQKRKQAIILQPEDRQFQLARQREYERIDQQCRRMEARVKQLQSRNKTASIIKPRNFIIVGVISFILGFVFA